MGKKSSRKKGMLVVKPIIYGNASVYLGKKAVDGVRTHNWTVYVRGLTPEDDLSYISKVEFMLHPDFKDPTRIVEHPPFEISEGGWGEFEIQINIYFKDPTIKPINVYHPLKLWSAEQATATQRKPYVDESYDELLFFEPSEDFYQTLLANQPFKQNTPYRKSYRLSCQQTIDQYGSSYNKFVLTSSAYIFRRKGAPTCE
jgi:YEATS domain-containing protein 4